MINMELVIGYTISQKVELEKTNPLGHVLYVERKKSNKLSVYLTLIITNDTIITRVREILQNMKIFSKLLFYRGDLSRKTPHI